MANLPFRGLLSRDFQEAWDRGGPPPPGRHTVDRTWYHVGVRQEMPLEWFELVRERFPEIPIDTEARYENPHFTGVNRTTTALSLACLFGREDLVAWFLAQGASPEGKAGSDGRTALTAAVTDPRGTVILRRLLEAGARVDRVDDHGNTALHYLSCVSFPNHPHAETNMARELMRWGARDDLVNRKGHTPRTLAFALARGPPWIEFWTRWDEEARGSGLR